MAKTTLTIANNGAMSRRKNKKIVLMNPKDGEYMINFAFADENPNNPAVSHNCVRNKIRVSQIKLSEEALFDICKMFMEYKKSKL